MKISSRRGFKRQKWSYKARKYTYKDFNSRLKLPEELFNNGDWEGIVYDNWFKATFIKMWKRLSDYLIYFDE